MVERDFEAQLERMFNQPPALADNDDFTRRVTHRLEKGSRLRGVFIALAGAVGGIIAVSQTLGAVGVGGLRRASAQTDVAATDLYHQVFGQTGGLDIAGYDLSATLFWAVSAMVVLGAGAFSARLFSDVT